MNRPKTDGQKNGKKVGNLTQQQYKNTTFKVNIVKVKADYKTTEMLLRESKYMFEVKICNLFSAFVNISRLI